MFEPQQTAASISAAHAAHAACATGPVNIAEASHLVAAHAAHLAHAATEADRIISRVSALKHSSTENLGTLHSGSNIQPPSTTGAAEGLDFRRAQGVGAAPSHFEAMAVLQAIPVHGADDDEDALDSTGGVLLSLIHI